MQRSGDLGQTCRGAARAGRRASARRRRAAPGARCPRATRRVELEVGAGEHAVALDVGHQDRRTGEPAQARAELGQAAAAPSVQPATRTSPCSMSSAGTTGPGARGQGARRRRGRGPPASRPPPGRSRRRAPSSTAVAVAQAAAELHGGSRCRHRLDQLPLRRLAERGVEVHHVDARRPRPARSREHGERIVAVDGRARSSSPWRSRTARPSRRSIAGSSSIGPISR